MAFVSENPVNMVKNLSFYEDYLKNSFVFANKNVLMKLIPNVSTKCVQFVKLKEMEMNRISLLLSFHYFFIPFLQQKYFNKNICKSIFFYFCHTMQCFILNKTFIFYVVIITVNNLINLEQRKKSLLVFLFQLFRRSKTIITSCKIIGKNIFV